MAKRRQERNVLTKGERADEESEEGSDVDEANDGRGDTTAVVVGVEEVPPPPEVGNVTGDGKGGASNEVRTIMEVLEVCMEAMEEGYEEEAEEDGTEEKWRVLGGLLLALEDTGY